MSFLVTKYSASYHGARCAHGEFWARNE